MDTLPPEKTYRELALELCDSLLFVAAETDKEMARLKRLEVPRYQKVGEGSIEFHLKVLKELIQQI